MDSGVHRLLLLQWLVGWLSPCPALAVAPPASSPHPGAPSLASKACYDAASSHDPDPALPHLIMHLANTATASSLTVVVIASPARVTAAARRPRLDQILSSSIMAGGRGVAAPLSMIR